MSLLSDITSRIGSSLRAMGRDMAEALTGINSKPVWPPPADAARIAEYAMRKALYEGDHAAIFSPTAEAAHLRFPRDTSRPYVSSNLCGALTDLKSSRLFGEPCAVTVPAGELGTQQFIEWLDAENGLQRLLLEQDIAYSWRGDMCLQVTYKADEKRLSIGARDPAHVYPEYDPLDAARVVAVNIDYLLGRGDKAYLWRERHELRDDGSYVLNKLYLLEQDDDGAYHFDSSNEVPLETLEELAGKAPEAATGIDDLLVMWIDGETDYTPALISLQGEYNNRLSQRGSVLDKHVDPPMIGPRLPDDMKAGGQVKVSELKYLEREEGETGTLEYVVWDAQLAAVKEQLETVKSDFALCAGVDLTALFPNQGGAAPSGSALRRQEMKTQATVMLRQRVWEPILQRLFSICTKLAAATGPTGLLHPLAFVPQAPEAQDTPGEPQAPQNLKVVAVQPQDITVVFSDGLPPDQEEAINQQVTRLSAGAQTLAAALMAMDNLTAEEAATKAEAIRAERQAALPAAPTVGLGAVSFGALPDAGGE